MRTGYEIREGSAEIARRARIVEVFGPKCLYGNPPERDCGARACAIHGTASASPYGKRQGARR